jgi:hypothetical protein
MSGVEGVGPWPGGCGVQSRYCRVKGYVLIWGMVVVMAARVRRKWMERKINDTLIQFFGVSKIHGSFKWCICTTVMVVV